ncbi:cathepsin O isoform X3 [Balaenoptera acutorostrata]|uniref:Cathepsin O isoform X3 n=1 Tax=Balaenoptera acutorostrata TaxID=9767 RepID=A0ABM3TLB4_BALAC|nr:cathepsin O isoform X3 [Balaenoptera acutorostrata]
MKVKLNSAAACIFPSETKGGGRRGLTQQVRSRDSGAVTPVRGRPSGSLPEAGGDPGARPPARAPRPAQREAAVRGRRTPISGRRGRRGVTVSAPRPARGPQCPGPAGGGSPRPEGSARWSCGASGCSAAAAAAAAPAPPRPRRAAATRPPPSGCVLSEGNTVANKTDQPGPHFAYRFMGQTRNKHESLNRHRQLNSLFPGENSTAVYGINQFSYLFPEEFKAIYLRSRPSGFPRFPAGTHTSISNLSLPLRFDWRDKHVVTPVRNQQTMQVKLVRDSEYPFKAQNGLCRYFSDSHFGFSIKGYSAYDFRDHEDEMAKALLTLGPLIVVVDAVSWQDYLGGIIQHHCSSGEANHAVLVTGFDKTGSTPYWIVRNSWGTSWGIDGCVHVKMGGNICGIAESVSAVFV